MAGCNALEAETYGDRLAPFAVVAFDIQIAINQLPATPEGVPSEEARVDPAGERIIGVIATDREAAVGLTARGVVIGAMWVTHAGIVSETVPVGARWRVVMPVGGVDSRGGIMKGDNE